MEVGEERSCRGAGLLCRWVVALVEKVGWLQFGEGMVCIKRRGGSMWGLVLAEMEMTAKREMKWRWARGRDLLAEGEEDGVLVWRRKIQIREGFCVVG